jgi:hypothetical protein
VLEALAPRVPERFFSQVWGTVREMPGKTNQAKMLEVLAPRVPEGFFSQFLQAAQAMPDEARQAKVLEALAPGVPERFSPHFWRAVRAMGNAAKQAQVLKALIPHLPREKLADVRQMVQALPYGETRIELLEALVPYLPEGQCAELLEALVPLLPGVDEGLEATWLTRWHVRTVAVLLPRLAEKRLLAGMPAVLKMISIMRPEEERVWALTKLAFHVPEELLKEFLGALWSIDMPQHQAQVLAKLLPPLSEAGWATVLELATTKMRDTGDANFLLQVLKAAGSLVEQASPIQLYHALHEVLHLLAQRTRRDTLADLALLAPAMRARGGEEAVVEVCCAALEVGYWWP